MTSPTFRHNIMTRRATAFSSWDALLWTCRAGYTPSLPAGQDDATDFVRAALIRAGERVFPIAEPHEQPRGKIGQRACGGDAR